MEETNNVENEEVVHENAGAELSEEASQIEELSAKLKEKEDAHLRLFAEFDNYKKRTAKEKVEFAKIASKGVMMDFVAVLDDIHRAHENIDASDNLEAVKEGVDLIWEKLWKVLQNKGLAEMNVVGEMFDPELHEAITEIPAPSENDKGKVLDQVERGYKLNDKIIRYPKVVVGK